MPLDREADVVVVGSGAGGGAVAEELAPLVREGLRVLVLEEGPRFREEDFTGREVEMASRLYPRGGGVLTRDRSVSLAMGRGYGGSTIVYTGTSLAIREPTVRRWGVPGIEHADLARRSTKYLDRAGAHLLEPELLNENNRLFRDACRSLGWSVEQFPVNVKGCQGSGLCNLGCPNQAKQGTNRVQLPAAERAGVVVVTGCRVERVEEGACFATVTASPVGAPSPWEPGEYRIRARAVVLCAGAVHTPAILLRSGLDRDLPALGCWFTCHPATIVVGQHERPITTHVGHPKSFVCEEFTASRRFLLESCAYFPFTTARSLGGFGAEHARTLERFDRLQMILALTLDDSRPENRVTIDRAGQPIVDYRLSREVLDALHGAVEAGGRILFAAGARRVHGCAPGWIATTPEELATRFRRADLRPGEVTISAAHLMGGCRMGTDRATSVTDAWGQVHGRDGLFVADASLFPGCSEVNPWVTVMALADRVAERVRERVRTGA